MSKVIYTADDGWQCEFNQPVDLLTANLYAAMMREGLDRAQHYKAASNALWHKGTREFIWHPWADDMLDAACLWDYLGVTGCGSSGKTVFFGGWGILNFLCSPENTLVLITTTTMKDANQRIWGTVQRFWNALDPGIQCIGRLSTSQKCIRYVDPATGKMDEMAGIYLVADDQGSTDEASAKFIGKKNKRVILIADELPELSEALMEAAYTNLTLNNYTLPSGKKFKFQCIGLGNFKSYFDSFGKLAKPKTGYQTIHVGMTGWETDLGYCLHLDGMKSPNIGLEIPKYPFLFKQDDLDDALRRNKSDRSPGFYRMVRGFPCPTGETDNVYCEADIIKFECEGGVTWAEPPIPLAGLDPAFTNGGDRSMLCLMWFGINVKTMVPTLCLNRFEMLVSDVTDTKNPHSYQIIEQARDICIKEKIDPKHCGFDSTGGGAPFGDIIYRIWSPNLLEVNFGGAASELPVGAHDPTPACQRYADRVTELWFGLQEYMRSEQIKGLTTDVIKEMCIRKYESVKRAGVEMPKVETKRDMKLRTGGVSPDCADALMITAEVCRQRLALGRVLKPEGQRKETKNTARFSGRKNVISRQVLVRK